MAEKDEKTLTFIGFAPDFDPMSMALWLDCDGLIGTMKGFRPEPGGVGVYEPIGQTFLLYDRHETNNVYAIVFTEFITIGPSSGPAVAGIDLNEDWAFFIQDGVAQYGQEQLPEDVPWSNIRPFFVDTSDPELQLNYG